MEGNRSQDALVPAADHVAFAELKLDRLAAGDGTVEDLAEHTVLVPNPGSVSTKDSHHNLILDESGRGSIHVCPGELTAGQCSVRGRSRRPRGGRPRRSAGRRSAGQTAPSCNPARRLPLLPAPRWRSSSLQQRQPRRAAAGAARGRGRGGPRSALPGRPCGWLTPRGRRARCGVRQAWRGQRGSVSVTVRGGLGHGRTAAARLGLLAAVIMTQSRNSRILCESLAAADREALSDTMGFLNHELPKAHGDTEFFVSRHVLKDKDGAV